MDNALQMLSLARRAGKLAYGFDAVAGAIQTGRAALVLISAQAAGRTERNIRRIAGENGVPVAAVPYSPEDWFPVLGKAVAVLAVTDPNLARGFRDRLAANEAAGQNR